MLMESGWYEFQSRTALKVQRFRPYIVHFSTRHPRVVLRT